jgi:hypothetical protein
MIQCTNNQLKITIDQNIEPSEAHEGIMKSLTNAIKRQTSSDDPTNEVDKEANYWLMVLLESMIPNPLQLSKAFENDPN